MLTIRLQRAGKRNKADFRLVLAEKTAAAQKKFTEILGSYNPHTKALSIRNQDRLNYWINEQHVEVSATAHNLLVSKELVKADKKKSFTIPKKEAPEETVASEEAPATAPEAAEAPAETSAPDTQAEETAPVEPVVEEAPAAEPATEVAPEAPAEVSAEESQA